MAESAPSSWVLLHETTDGREANAVCMSILAMEFDARVIDLASGEPVEDPEAAPAGPFGVQVPEADAEPLREVLGEIVAEQREFDHALAARDHSAAAWRRRAMLFMAMLVAVLALLGLLRL